MQYDDLVEIVKELKGRGANLAMRNDVALKLPAHQAFTSLLNYTDRTKLTNSKLKAVKDDCLHPVAEKFTRQLRKLVQSLDIPVFYLTVMVEGVNIAGGENGLCVMIQVNSDDDFAGYQIIDNNYIGVH